MVSLPLQMNTGLKVDYAVDLEAANPTDTAFVEM
jgi:hypothetical protein